MKNKQYNVRKKNESINLVKMLLEKIVKYTEGTFLKTYLVSDSIKNKQQKALKNIYIGLTVQNLLTSKHGL